MKLLLLSIISVQLFAAPIMHKLALNTVEFASPEESIPFTGFYRLKKQSEFFFKDLGAEFVSDESGLQGFYLPFTAVKKNSGKVFGKWREQLKDPKNTKLLSLFEANLSGSNLSSLFSFPGEVHFLKDAKKKVVLIFLDFSIPLTMQIREILNFSLRGYNVFAVDFYHYEEGKRFIPWDLCKSIADSAYQRLRGEVILYGKSFGSAPAAYLATKHDCDLILDRPFTCMNEALGSVLLENFISMHYSYPTKNLIAAVKRAPLIISCTGSMKFKDHADNLMNAYINSHKKISRDTILSRCFISTRGGHYSSLLNKGMSSWFSYQEAQNKLNKYLSSSAPN